MYSQRVKKLRRAGKNAHDIPMRLDSILSKRGEWEPENHKDTPSNMMQRAVFAFMDASPGRIDFSICTFTIHPRRTSAPIVTAHTEVVLMNSLIRCAITRSIVSADMDIRSVLEGVMIRPEYVRER